MATYETYKECEDALDELTQVCHNSNVKRDLFTAVANRFQEIFDDITPNYYKANQQDLITLTKDITQLINKIKQLNEKYERYF